MGLGPCIWREPSRSLSDVQGTLTMGQAGRHAPAVLIPVGKTLRGTGDRRPGSTRRRPAATLCPGSGYSSTGRLVAQVPALVHASEPEMSDLTVSLLGRSNGLQHRREDSASAQREINSEGYSSVVRMCLDNGEDRRRRVAIAVWRGCSHGANPVCCLCSFKPLCWLQTAKPGPHSCPDLSGTVYLSPRTIGIV